VVVDGDVQILPAGSAGPFLHQPCNAVSRLADAGQALDVEVDHVAGMVALIADHRGRRVKGGEPVKPGATQNPADGGPADSHFVGDAPAVPAQPAKGKNLFQ
jgi:hypothetical protein